VNVVEEGALMTIFPPDSISFFMERYTVSLVTFPMVLSSTLVTTEGKRVSRIKLNALTSFHKGKQNDKEKKGFHKHGELIVNGKSRVYFVL
jgi:hypothetical protein